MARLLRELPRAGASRLLAPLVVARKGYYTDLATWAAGKGFAHLRVDGAWTPTDAWPRLDRFKEHDIELPVGELRVSRRRRSGRCATLLDRALDVRQGRGARRPAATGRGAARHVVFSTRRACPRCGRSFAELDPRLFSFNSQARLVPALLRHRPAHDGVRRGADGRGDLVERLVGGRGAPVPGLRRAAGCARRRWRCASADRIDRRVHGAAGGRGRASCFRALRLQGREARDRARHPVPSCASRLAFLWRGRAAATCRWTAPRRR